MFTVKTEQFNFPLKNMTAYWLMKSEPQVYSLADLAREGETLWDGVRNYQARNFLRQMQVGDRVFFYHSNSQPPAIVGLARVTAVDIVDPSQFDCHSDYFDPRATVAQPRWWTVRVGFESQFSQPLSLATLKQTFADSEFLLVKKGCRLSVLPVPPDIAEQILRTGAGAEPSRSP
jgi:predicted RNA-binding protein with PUA-like domain